MKTGPVIGTHAGADFRPSHSVRANRTCVLVQKGLPGGRPHAVR